MIFDSVDNANVYKGISEDFREAFELLEDKGIAEKSDGTYSTGNPNLKYTVMTAETRAFDSAEFEIHKNHADIQVVVKGAEQMGVYPAEQLRPACEYDAERDLLFCENPERYNIIDVSEGQFCVFFPHDGHLPLCHSGKPGEVKKIIVKVRLND